MSAVTGMALASEVFKSINGIIGLIPTFSEKKREKLDEETEKLIVFEKAFEKAALSFGPGSRSDELLGLADEVSIQKRYIENLYIIYAKELRS